MGSRQPCAYVFFSSCSPPHYQPRDTSDSGRRAWSSICPPLSQTLVISAQWYSYVMGNDMQTQKLRSELGNIFARCLATRPQAGSASRDHWTPSKKDKMRRVHAFDSYSIADLEMGESRLRQKLCPFTRTTQQYQRVQADKPLGLARGPILQSTQWKPRYLNPPCVAPNSGFITFVRGRDNIRGRSLTGVHCASRTHWNSRSNSETAVRRPR